jgi:YD repeat-containing protein
MRTNPKGLTQGLSVNLRTGVYTSELNSSTSIVTHVFKTPGHLYNKISYIERIVSGVPKTVYRASYDSAGHLIRKINENNIVISYTYDNAGNKIGEQVSLSSDPAILADLAHQEQGLIATLNEANDTHDARKKLGALNDLMIFYIAKDNLKLYLAISNPSHTIDQRNAMLNDLVKEYPDKTDYTSRFMMSN